MIVAELRCSGIGEFQREPDSAPSEVQLLPFLHRWNVMSEQRNSAEGSMVCGVIED